MIKILGKPINKYRKLVEIMTNIYLFYGSTQSTPSVSPKPS